MTPTHVATDAPNGLDAKTLERVRALLAKAESTAFPGEAEAFTVKAQELMARYGIDAAMMASAARQASSPTQRRLRLDPPYTSAKSLLLAVVADANRCASVWSKATNEAIVFGFDVDLDVVELLFVSLHLQATSAMVAAGQQTDQVGRSRTKSFRHAFLTSFAQRIGERLREATESAVAEAEAQAQPGHAVVPVLTERIEAVKGALKEAFPHTTKHSATASNHGGWHAGRAAADRANLHNRDELADRRRRRGA